MNDHFQAQRTYAAGRKRLAVDCVAGHKHVARDETRGRWAHPVHRSPLVSKGRREQRDLKVLRERLDYRAQPARSDRLGLD
jgi:hypothetical protein